MACEQRQGHVAPRLTVVALGLLLACGCQPLRKFMINQVAEELATSTASFHADEDPELIRESLPFALKMIEAMLQKTPAHQGLLRQACSGFTEYGYAFILQDADVAEDDDLTRAQTLRLRARKLFLRGRDYGLRGLDLRHHGFSAALREDPRTAVASLARKDIDFVYWVAAAWGSAISVGKDDPHLVADQEIVEALLDRALALDESYGEGAIHQALITYEMVRRGAQGAPEERARKHFERAVALSHGRRAGPYVTFAETVSVQTQNRKEFEELLQKALAVDVDAEPDARVENLVMQKRARWLLERKDELFVE